MKRRLRNLRGELHLLLTNISILLTCSLFPWNLPTTFIEHPHLPVFPFHHGLFSDFRRHHRKRISIKSLIISLQYSLSGYVMGDLFHLLHLGWNDDGARDLGCGSLAGAYRMMYHFPYLLDKVKLGSYNAYFKLRFRVLSRGGWMMRYPFSLARR